MRSLSRLGPQGCLCAAYLRERGSLLRRHYPQGEVVLTLSLPLFWRQPGLGVGLDRSLRQDLLGLRKGSRSRPDGRSWRWGWPASLGFGLACSRAGELTG